MESIQNSRYLPHITQNDDIYRFYTDSLVFAKSELPLGWHNQVEIIRITEGEGEFVISGRIYRVRAGSFVIINPGQIHSGSSYIGRPLKFQSLKFLYNYFDNTDSDNVFDKYIYPLINGNSYLPNSIISTFPIHSEVTSIFDELENNRYSKDETNEIYTKMLMYKLIYIFYHNNFVYGKSYNPANKKSSNDMVKLAINYIHDKYDEDISLELLSITLETSKPHLCRIFKRLTSQTVTEYHNNFRIKKACEFLADSEDSVAKIAFELGYSNISYFHNRFKRKTGFTPSEYRTINKTG